MINSSCRNLFCDFLINGQSSGAVRVNKEESQKNQVYYITTGPRETVTAHQEKAMRGTPMELAQLSK